MRNQWKIWIKRHTQKKMWRWLVCSGLENVAEAKHDECERRRMRSHDKAEQRRNSYALGSAENGRCVEPMKYSKQ